MSLNKGLGKGLGALFSDAPAGRPGNSGTEEAPRTLPLADIKPNAEQPRKNFNDESLQELAESIRRQGILQPLLVRPLGNGYQLVAGERRWRAAKLAGLGKVPVVIRVMDDRDVMVAALIENLQREDLNPVEEARALAKLQETLDLTQDALASRLGKSRPAIANALRLLRLSTAAQDDVEQGRMSAGHARCLLTLEADDPVAAEELRQRILSANLTVRQTEDAAAHWRQERQFPWKEQEPVAPVGETPLADAPAGKRRKDPLLATLQDFLCKELPCKARFSGNRESGRLTLTYSSPEELRQILQRMSCPWDDVELSAETPDNTTAETEAADMSGVMSDNAPETVAPPLTEAAEAASLSEPASQEPPATH